MKDARNETHLVVANTIVIPAVPTKNPGNARCQKFSRESAKGKSTVPVRTKTSPTQMTYFRGNFCWRTDATPMTGKDTKPSGRLERNKIVNISRAHRLPNRFHAQSNSNTNCRPTENVLIIPREEKLYRGPPHKRLQGHKNEDAKVLDLPHGRRP